ncbi:MAG: dTDP-4-dehydrorhamnose reductase [Candidatus Eremiobacteraeota bacterium]|nr:dTDP-4-dehydrorhamnose reductase [Candidatus Eremiobacteraeota bacterium]
MRVLLFGGSGQLGSDILRLWRDDQIVAPSSAELNIENHGAVRAAVLRASPELVVNCTAYNKVDAAETEPERAFAVNTFAVEAMTQAAEDANARFVTFSSDYVFDGEKGEPYAESDRPNPQTVYGVSKLAGELLVERHDSNALIVRVCGLYGTRTSTSKGYTFIDRIIARARAGEHVDVVSDQIVSPTYAAHVALAVRSLLDRAIGGVVHMVNEGAVSWYDFAIEALRAAAVDASIEPVSYASWPATAKRPRFSALRNARLGAAGLSMPDWRTGIADYLRDKGAS